MAINTDNAYIILNRKSEFNSQKIPRLTIEIGDKVNQVEYSGHTLGKRDTWEKGTNPTPNLPKKQKISPAPTKKTTSTTTKTKKDVAKIMKGQGDIRNLLTKCLPEPELLPLPVLDGLETRANIGDVRGGGKGGRGNPTLPSASPSALPPLIEPQAPIIPLIKQGEAARGPGSPMPLFNGVGCQHNSNDDANKDDLTVEETRCLEENH